MKLTFNIISCMITLFVLIYIVACFEMYISEIRYDKLNQVYEMPISKEFYIRLDSNSQAAVLINAHKR